MVTRKRTCGKNPLAEKQDSGQNFKNPSVSDYHPKNKPNLTLPKSITHSKFPINLCRAINLNSPLQTDLRNFYFRKL